MNDRTSLIVHIGHGKTGSTSIQHTLLQNRDALIGQGVCYLGRMLEDCETPDPKPWQHPDGAVRLLHQMEDDDAAEEIRNVLNTELERLNAIGVHTAIWSNEALFARRNGVAKAIVALRDQGISVRVIVYLRRHDKWAKSAYAQWGIRHKSYEGPVKTFANWIAERPVHFADNLEFWDQNSGRDLVVRNFDATPDVVSDFLSLAGTENIDPVHAYETPPPETLIAWAVHNSRTNSEVQPDRFARLLNASHLLGQSARHLPEPSELIPSTKDLAAVLAQSMSDLGRVNAIFKNHNVVGFDANDPATGSTPPTQWEMMQFMMAMIFSLQEQVLRLKRRLDEFEN